MGFWDWATTAREGVQGALGVPKSVNLPSTPGDVGSNLKNAWSGGILPHIMGALMTGNPVNTVGANKPGIIQQLAGGANKPAAPPTAPPTTPTTPTDPNSGYMINPLATNLFFAQAIQPLLTNLANQLQGWDQQAYGMMQNTAGQQFIPQQYQAILNTRGPQMLQDANNVTAGLMGAAEAGPSIDALNTAMGNIQQQNVRNYSLMEALRSLGLVQASGGLGTPTGTSGTGTNATNPLAAIEAAFSTNPIPAQTIPNATTPNPTG